MTIFEELEQWLAKNRERLEKDGFSVRFVQGKPTENTAAGLDIDSERVVARVTLWESMEMDIEAIEAGSAKQLIFETQTVKDLPKAFRLIDDFFDRLR